MGTSAPVIRSGAASRKSNAGDSQIWAMISDPTPNAGKPPSTVTRWFVFLTDLMMVSISSGRMDLLISYITDRESSDVPEVDDLDLDTLLLL